MLFFEFVDRIGCHYYFNSAMAKTIKLTVRMPEEMHKALAVRARDSNRSLNAQVLRFIRYGLDSQLVRKYLIGIGWTPPKNLAMNVLHIVGQLAAFAGAAHMELIA